MTISVRSRNPITRLRLAWNNRCSSRSSHTTGGPDPARSSTSRIISVRAVFSPDLDHRTLDLTANTPTPTAIAPFAVALRTLPVAALAAVPSAHNTVIAYQIP
jgi:hypothetical protein